MELPVLDGWPLVTRNLALKAVAFSLVPLSLSWRQVASVAVCGSASTVRFSRDPHRNRDKPIRLGLVGPPLLRAGATHRECPGDSGLGRGHEFGSSFIRQALSRSAASAGWCYSPGMPGRLRSGSRTRIRAFVFQGLDRYRPRVAGFPAG